MHKPGQSAFWVLQQSFSLLYNQNLSDISYHCLFGQLMLIKVVSCIFFLLDQQLSLLKVLRCGQLHHIYRQFSVFQLQVFSQPIEKLCFKVVSLVRILRILFFFTHRLIFEPIFQFYHLNQLILCQSYNSEVFDHNLERLIRPKQTFFMEFKCFIDCMIKVFIYMLYHILLQDFDTLKVQVDALSVHKVSLDNHKSSENPMVELCVDVYPLGSLSDLFFRPQALSLTNLLIDHAREVGKILLINVEKRLLNIFELLLVLDNKGRIVHKVVKIRIRQSVLLVGDIKWLSLEGVIEELLLLLLKLLQRLVNFGVDLLLSLLLRLRLRLIISSIKARRCFHSFKYIQFSESEYNLQAMQSYQLHIISEHLKRRHPYLQPPFKARYDSTEVYKAVFDRAIPKLIEILLTQSLAPDRYTNALITLNELASDQVQKSNMIEQGCVGLASAFSHCKVVSIRREATLLLGLLLSTNQGLSKMSKQTFTGLKALLFDEELQVRNAVSWTICRIALSRLGADILCRQQITKSIVESFLKYSSLEQAKEEYFIIYLLVTFKHLLVYDSGIKFSLGTGLTNRLKQLTATKVYSVQGNASIHQLSLAALSNIAMNPEGKIECVKQEVIAFTEHFLESSQPLEVGNTVSLIMFTAINLLGKKQCIYNREGKVDTAILVKIIKLLSKEDLSQHTRRDVMQALKIISQQIDGFLAIADFMSKNSDIKHVQQIFGSTIIIPLAKLLPSVAQVAQPPTLPSNKINDYKSYAKAINYFMQKDKAATEIALKDCVDLATKLVMFMCYRGDKVLQEGIAQTLIKLASAHPYSAKILKDFLKIHGNAQHKISKTSVIAEVKRFQKLSQILETQ